MSDYSFSLVHPLSDSEIFEIKERCSPSLRALCARYIAEVDPSKGFPSGPNFLDVLRTSWLLDSQPEKPEFSTLVNGLGYAFGLVLKKEFQLQWFEAIDSNGKFITMARSGTANFKAVSIPPFGYVEKREHLQNAEVFHDFFAQIPAAVGL